MDIPYVDIHAHRCAPEPGVEKVCVYLPGRGDALPGGRFTAGVHPWDVGKADPAALDFFREPPSGLVGVGEIGLDFAVRELNKPLQQEWFARQLAIAERLGLPVVLHCVRAYDEVQAELKKYRLKAVVFHGFTGSPELAGQLVGQGYCLSFGALSLRSPKTVEALKITPPGRLFLETDDDPSARIEALYVRVALLRGTTVEVLKAAIYHNYEFLIPNS